MPNKSGIALVFQEFRHYKGNVMDKRFWFSFCLFGLTAVGLMGLAGFSLMKVHETRIHQDFLKKSLRAHNHFYLHSLNQKKAEWQREAWRIIERGEIPAQSPFSAFALNPGGGGGGGGETFYTAPDLFPPTGQATASESVMSHSKTKDSSETKDPKEPLSPLSKQLEMSRQTFLSEIKSLTENLPRPFHKSRGLGLTKASLPRDDRQHKGQPAFLFLLSSSFGEDKVWMAFFKKEESVFPSFIAPLAKKNKSRETFIVRQNGLILTSDKKGAQTGALPKKSPLLKILRQIEGDIKAKSRYLKTSDKKTGRLYFHHIQKWDGEGLFLVSRQGMRAPVFSWRNAYFNFGLTACVLLFVFIFRLFLIRLLCLLSAYRFLKQAFLIFNKTGLFPESPKNPLLYFYNNRKMFLNQRQKDSFEKNKDTITGRFNIREIIRQETAKLKTRFPQMDVREDFDFDTRVFGFEKFLRSLIHELFLNGLEAMGGLKEPRLDLSLREEKGYLVFSVRDYGIGIRDQDRDKIFRVYYSTKSQTGVGLNLVQSLVKANNGKIVFDSPKGGGCRVTVHLPVQCFLKSAR